LYYTYITTIYSVLQYFFDKDTKKIIDPVT